MNTRTDLGGFLGLHGLHEVRGIGLFWEWSLVRPAGILTDSI